MHGNVPSSMIQAEPACGPVCVFASALYSLMRCDHQRTHVDVGFWLSAAACLCLPAVRSINSNCNFPEKRVPFNGVAVTDNSGLVPHFAFVIITLAA